MANLAGFQRSERQSRAKRNTICRERRHSRSRCENSLQVQRVGRAQRDQFVTWCSFADRSQRTDRFGERELLAADASDEIAATNFAARFPPAINPTELVPGHGETLPFKQAAEDYAITSQQHAREFFDGGIAMSRICPVRFN